MRKTPVKAKKVVVEPYKVMVKVLGKTYTSNAPTILEALGNFAIRNVHGVRSIIVVEHGDHKKERILQPMQTNRLFNSHGMTREVQLKNISMLFQGV